MEGDRATKFESVSSLSLRSTLFHWIDKESFSRRKENSFRCFSSPLMRSSIGIQTENEKDDETSRWWNEQWTTIDKKCNLSPRRELREKDRLEKKLFVRVFKQRTHRSKIHEDQRVGQQLRPFWQKIDFHVSLSLWNNCLERRGAKTSLFFARSTRDGQCSRSVRWSRRWFSSSSHSIWHFFHWMSFVVTFWSFHSNDAASSNGQTIARMMDKSVHWEWPSHETIDERWQCQRKSIS